MAKNEFVLDIKTIEKLNSAVSEADDGAFEQHLGLMMTFFTKREPGSTLELTREKGEENLFSWKGFVRERLMKMMGTETDGDVSHPAGKRMKITYATDYQDLKVGWIMEQDGTQVYQVEFEAAE